MILSEHEVGDPVKLPRVFSASTFLSPGYLLFPIFFNVTSETSETKAASLHKGLQKLEVLNETWGK